MVTRRHALLTLASAAVVRSEETLTSMFDGKTLAGWRIQNGPESAFFVHDGSIVIHEGSGFPTWLRYDRVVENFDFRCEFFIKGWNNGGIFLHAPEHGRPTSVGMKINIFQRRNQHHWLSR